VNAIAVMLPFLSLLLHGSVAFGGGAGSTSADRSSLSLIGHRLVLEIDPGSHRLSATDAMVVNAGPGGVDGARFHLSQALKARTAVE